MQSRTAGLRHSTRQLGKLRDETLTNFRLHIRVAWGTTDRTGMLGGGAPVLPVPLTPNGIIVSEEFTVSSKFPNH